MTGMMIILLIIITTSLLAGSKIEANIFPITQSSHVSNSVRITADELCWAVHYRKLRNDAPAYFNYRIRYSGTEERIPLAVYRIKDDGSRVYLSTYGFANHNAGQIWDAHYCADLPRGISLHRPFIVEGEGFYDTWHHLWLVPQTLPSFIVGAE